MVQHFLIKPPYPQACMMVTDNVKVETLKHIQNCHTAMHIQWLPTYSLLSYAYIGNRLYSLITFYWNWRTVERYIFYAPIILVTFKNTFYVIEQEARVVFIFYIISVNLRWY